jgi:type I restriction enzyme S subunit
MNSNRKITAMKEETTPAPAPNLRFPEFLEAEDWKYKPLSACLNYQQPTRYLVSNTNYSPAFKTPVLTAGKTFILGYTDEDHGIFNQGLPVIIFDDFTTATQFVDFPFKAKSSAMKILEAKDGANIKFMYESFQAFSFEVGAHERHWISRFAPMLVSVPTSPEQQKIADCLSSMDELIAAQARKVNAIKSHKKGLMQQLFPRAGETQPRLRFPAFKNAGAWGCMPLGKLLVRSPDYGVNAAAVPFSELLPKYLRITDISGDGIYLSQNMVSVDIEPTNGNYLDEGDIVVARTGASVGKSYRYRKEDGRLVFAGFLIRIKPVKQKVVSAYIANFMTTDLYWDWVAVTSTRSGQPGINSPEYSSLSIPLPPGDLAEQQRIADCLTSLDDLIVTQTQKLEILKTHKKGLMHQLFPSPAEVQA